MEFGENLKRARESKGFTQQHLADKLFVTRQAVSKWECGTRYPDLMTTKCIADILEVSIDSLVSDDDMKVFSEKQNIINNQATSKVITTLYAIVSLLAFIKSLSGIMNFVMSMDDSIVFDIKFFIISVIPIILYILAAIVSAVAFVKTLRNDVTPKVAGSIGICFFIYYAVQRITVMLSYQLNIGMLAESILYILIAAVIYLYFFTKKSSFAKLVYVCCAIASVLIIANPAAMVIAYLSDPIYNDIRLINPVHYIEMFAELSYICILVLQTRKLERKRKLSMLSLDKPEEKSK